MKQIFSLSLWNGIFIAVIQNTRIFQNNAPSEGYTFNAAQQVK
jgi:hypothetical protein